MANSVMSDSELTKNELYGLTRDGLSRANPDALLGIIIN
jgi:hypothetical protein